MEDFEALGRYVTAKEQAEQFARDRNGHLSTASKLIDQTRGHASGIALAYDFDPMPVQEAISKATEAHKNMILAVNEANRQADACGKSKLKIEKSSY